jgi:beta-lactamase regulating signal transducer with metallopeptidase domain
MNHWNDWGASGFLVLAQWGLSLLVQTSLLLAPGLWALHRLQRKPGARTLLGRVLLSATAALVLLSLSPWSASRGRVPSLWNVSLPVHRAAPTNAPTAFLAVASPLIRAENRRAGGPQISALPANETVKQAGTSSTSTTREVLSPPQREPAPRLASSPPATSGQTARLWNGLGLLMLVWPGGAFILLIWLGTCHGALWRLRRGAHPVTDAAVSATLAGVCATLQVRVPLLLRHHRANSPFLTGLLRPAIVLCGTEAPSEEALRAVLLHEATHLKRLDLWWNTLGRIGCVLLWPQPLLWMLCRQIEQINEDACDQAALSAGCAPGQYARCLLDWAQRQMPRPFERIAGAGMLTHRSSLSRRVQSILSGSPPDTRPVSNRLRWTMMGGALAGVLALPLLVSSNPVTVTSGDSAPEQKGASPAAPPEQRALEHFKTSGDYRIQIDGVSGGVLQGVSILEQKKGVVTRLSLARTMRRQTGATSQSPGWVLGEGATYTFDANQGLISEMSFERLSRSFASSSLGDFLEQQTRAVSEAVTDSHWQGLLSVLAPPQSEIKALQAWGKGKNNAGIAGRVVGEDGRPIAGATVELQMSDETVERILKTPKNSFARIYGHMFALPKTTRDLLSQSALTQSDGTYRFGGLAAVPYELRMARYGRDARLDFNKEPPAQVLTQSRQVLPRASGTTPAPDLVLTRGGLLHIRVEDKDTSAPLSDVMVLGSSGTVRSAKEPTFFVATNASGESLFRLPAGKASVAISSSGQSAPRSHAFVAFSNGVFYKISSESQFSLDGGAKRSYGGVAEVQVGKGRTREIVIGLPRYVAPTPTPVPRRLPPPLGKAALTGRVVDEEGRPVGGIPVWAHIQQKAQWPLMQGAGLAYSNNDTPDFDKKWASIQGVLSRTATTRPDGTFRLDGLTTAPYNLIIATSNGNFGLKPPSGWVAPAVEGVWAKEGQVVRRSAPIVLMRGALIQGRVVDKASGLPLGGVSFGSNGPQLPTSTDDVMSATSDAQGRFSLRVAPGTSSLYIAGPNQGTEQNMVYADTRKTDRSYRIGTSRGFYAGSDNVRFEIDGGAPQFGLNMGAGSSGRIEIPAQQGQTRRLTLHLRRLVPKR